MSFKTGDICVIVKTMLNHEFLGTECTVSHRGIIFYEVVSAGEAHTRFALPFQLRLKRPPDEKRQELGEWELCPWQPKRENA